MHSAKRFFKRWQNWLALILVAFFFAMAIAAPLLSPVDTSLQAPGARRILGNQPNPNPTPPSEEEPLGTLPKDISVYHKIIWGSRSALSFGLGVTAIIAAVGTLIGTLSAYWGGWPSKILIWITDSFLAFPLIAAVVLINQLMQYIWVNVFSSTMDGGFQTDIILGQLSQPLSSNPLEFLQRIPPLAIAFVLFLWMPYAKVMHTSVLQKKQQEYILAAKVSGVKTWRIIWRHLLPNAIGPVIVTAAKDVGAVVVLQSAFSFAQLGQSDSPWSGILITAKDYLYAPGGLIKYWWLFLPATAAILLFGIAWNLLGDGINEALNPSIDR
ncbi:MAG: ABC transporter permease [Anaerolineaceae bacterium]